MVTWVTYDLRHRIGAMDGLVQRLHFNLLVG